MYKIAPSSLCGTVIIPPSKSHTLRAICFAALASGTSRIEDFLSSPDTFAMIRAVTLLGAKVKVAERTLIIQGFAGKPSVAEDVIDCGNAGIVLRFIGALAALTPNYSILTGDESIRHNRPVKPLLDALTQLGATAISSRGDHFAPILVKGPLLHSEATLDGSDSQPVSGLLIANAFAPHPINLHITNPGEKPWIDLTLDWFDRLGIEYERSGYTFYRTTGNTQLAAFNYRVPGDFSSAAFPMAAALLTQSRLTLENIDLSDVQGDKKIISLLEKMGAIFTRGTHSLTVEPSGILQGMAIDINDCIDALPILAVIGCFAKGKTEIYNGAIARCKESDRIHSIATELKKMGAQIEETADGLIIHQAELQGAVTDSHQDHRLLFSLAVASLAAKGHSTVHGVDCGAKTYPSFYEDFQRIGVKIKKG